MKKKLLAGTVLSICLLSSGSVSYTHLDVYKRQVYGKYVDNFAFDCIVEV